MFTCKKSSPVYIIRMIYGGGFFSLDQLSGKVSFSKKYLIVDFNLENVIF